MFTGLIEAVCRVRQLSRQGAGGRLEVDFGPLAGQVEVGESIAVDGCCLTVSAKQPPVVVFDLSAETVTRSRFGRADGRKMVNIERSLSASGRFGGHIVLGHVDGVGRIEAIERQGEFARFTFSTEKELLDEIVVKGSVAVDGISLTVASMDGRGFAVAAIPVTLAKTNLGSAKVGDIVNIETDIIGKMVKKQVAKMAGGKGLSMEKLADFGY